MSEYWPSPLRKSIGFYSDSKTFIDVLKYGASKDFFDKSELIDLLSNRVIGLLFVKKISTTGIENLLDELHQFGWIQIDPARRRIDLDLGEMLTIYTLTEQGKQAIKEYESNKKNFYNDLIYNLYKIYTIPGWFIQRLWDINPDGQGQVIIPSPPKKWNPSARKWEDNSWNKELTDVIISTYNTIITIDDNGFPILQDHWLKTVMRRWERLSDHAKKRKSKKSTQGIGEEKNELFSPRKRLALAMKEAAVELLFSNYNTRERKNDFSDYDHPLLARKLEGWSSRLEDLGLLYYTDHNPKIPGRILFPVCAFKNKLNPNFQIIGQIKNPKNQPLQLFKPNWSDFKSTFLLTLYEQYAKKHSTIKSMYVSIQDVRDEVCRILRINSLTFDEFLELASSNSLNNEINYRISLESDIREDQRGRAQSSRRPVYVYNKVVTIIAITEIQTTT